MLKHGTQVFRTVRTILMGKGSVSNTGLEASKLGASKVLVITDPGIAKVNLDKKVIESLQEKSLDVSTFDQVKPEPNFEIVAESTKVAKEGKYDLLIGLGGGSSIDVTKATAIMVKNEGSIRDYVGVDRISNAGLPTIMIPTTAGSGSEVTPITIFTDERKAVKVGIVSPHLLPSVTIVDPILTVTLPARVTAETGMDALTHAIEAYLSVNATLLSDTLVLKAISLISGNLRRAVACGDDVEARQSMSLGSLFAAMAFANVGVAAVHALAYPLGARYHLAHGLCNAMLLPSVMRFNLISNLQKFSNIAKAMGEHVDGLPLRSAATRAIRAVQQLSIDVGIPQHLKEVGVEEKAIAELASQAIHVKRLLANNPRVLSVRDMVAIYQESL